MPLDMLEARRLDAGGMCLWPLWRPKPGALACNLLHARELTEFGAIAEEHSPVRQQGQVTHLQDKMHCRWCCFTVQIQL